MNTRRRSIASAASVVKNRRPSLDVVLDQFGQARFEDRHHARPCSRSILPGSLSTQVHVVAEIGETGARHQADIAGTDHRDAHGG
jgi:hypothetical protein